MRLSPLLLLGVAALPGLAQERAVIHTPTPGTQLTDSGVVFRWNLVSGATGYHLEVGTSLGRSDYRSLHMNASTNSATVPNLPVDGTSTIYVRLNTKYGSREYYNDYTYRAHLGQIKSEIILPVPGSRISTPSVVFTWTSTPGATGYHLEVGSSLGRSDYRSIHTSPSITSATVPNLIIDGRLIYVRLNTKWGSREEFNDYTYTTGPPPPPTSDLRFVPVAPCRVIDTRNGFGALGGPVINGGETRQIPVTASACGIPSNARAYSLNTTVVPLGALAYLTLFPTGQTQPVVSTLNSFDGRIKANAAIVPAGTGGAISAFATNATHLILDINGYFIEPTSSPQALAFYPVAQCRITDTRTIQSPTFGSPLTAGQTLPVNVGLSQCGIPAYAQAYSLNATVYPRGPLAYLTLWPAGQGQPLVSTLNAFTGAAVANAAIVPAGVNGVVNAFVTDTTDLVIDINGYFAPAGYPGGLNFRTLNPCRVFDTRNGGSALGGPAVAPGQPRSFPATASACGIPGNAQVYSSNVTVVPQGLLAGLTLWGGGGQPNTPVLVALDGMVSANGMILQAAGGQINAASTHTTDTLLDINGYFLP